MAVIIEINRDSDRDSLVYACTPSFNSICSIMAKSLLLCRKKQSGVA